VNSLEKRLENQVQFWALLGPFLFLLSISVLVFKLTLHWYFPLSIMLGIPLCVKWKIKGMAVSLTFLFALTLYAYPDLNLNERYWHVGMALAMAFSFIILTLSLEEVEGVLTKLQVESKSRLENFLRLDDNSKKAEEAWVGEKIKLDNEMTVLSSDLAIAQQDKEIFYKLAQLAKDELNQIRTQHELLEQDLVYKKHHIFQLNEKLEETEITLQKIVDAESEGCNLQLKAELEESKINENKLQEDLNNLRENFEIIQKLNSDLKQLQEQSYANNVQEKQDLLESQNQLTSQILSIEQEKATLLEEIETLKIDYDQILIDKEQSREFCTTINDELLQHKKDLDTSKKVETSLTLQLRNIQDGLKVAQNQNEELRSLNAHLKLIESKSTNDRILLNQEKEDLIAKSNVLECQIVQIQNELEVSHKAAKELNVLAETYKKESDAILSEKTIYLEQIEQLKASETETNEKYIQTLQKLEEVHQQNQQDILRLKQERDEFKKQCDDLKILEVNLQEQLLSAQQEQKELSNQTDVLQKQLESTLQEQEELSQHTDALQKQLENSQQEQEGLLRQKDVLQKQLEGSQQEQKELSNQKKILQEQLNAIELEKIERIKEFEILKNEYEKILYQAQHQNEELSEVLEKTKESEKENLQKLNSSQKEKEQLLISIESLEACLEELKIEKLILEETLDATQINYSTLESSARDLDQCLSKSEQKIKYKENEIESLVEKKQHYANQLQAAEQKNANDKKELSAQIHELKQTIQSFETEKKKLEQEFHVIQEQLSFLKNGNQQNEKLLKQQCAEDFKTKEIEFETVLNEKIEEIKEWQSKLELASLNKDTSKTEIDLELHRTKSLYLQLKQQFQKKSQVLDQTRQELFVAQENALALQKNLEESEQFSTSESEELLQKAYTNLIQEFEVTQKESNFELEQLQSIIAHLTSKS